jgi:hypothetical protein
MAERENKQREQEKKLKIDQAAGSQVFQNDVFELLKEVTVQLPRRVKGDNALVSTFNPALNGDRKT